MWYSCAAFRFIVIAYFFKKRWYRFVVKQIKIIIIVHSIVVVSPSLHKAQVHIKKNLIAILDVNGKNNIMTIIAKEGS